MALGSALWSTISNPALSSKCNNRLTAQEIAEPACLAVCFTDRLVSCKELAFGLFNYDKELSDAEWWFFFLN